MKLYKILVNVRMDGVTMQNNMYRLERDERMHFKSKQVLNIIGSMLSL